MCVCGGGGGVKRENGGVMHGVTLLDLDREEERRGGSK